MSTNRLVCPHSQEFVAKNLIRQSCMRKPLEDLLLPTILGVW